MQTNLKLLRPGEFDLAVALVRDPLLDLLDCPSAHPSLLLLLFLLHGVAKAEVLGHGARVVLPSELEALVDNVASLLARVKRLVRRLFLCMLLVLWLARVPHILLVVELVPVLRLVLLVDVIPDVVEVIVVHVVPILELIDKTRLEVLVVEVLDKQRRWLVVGGVCKSLLLVLPDGGDLFAVQLVQRGDGLAPLAGSEGQRKGLATVDCGELECESITVQLSGWDCGTLHHVSTYHVRICQTDVLAHGNCHQHVTAADIPSLVVIVLHARVI